jgi:hypothetical protein
MPAVYTMSAGTGSFDALDPEYRTGKKPAVGAIALHRYHGQETASAVSVYLDPFADAIAPGWSLLHQDY